MTERTEGLPYPSNERVRRSERWTIGAVLLLMGLGVVMVAAASSAGDLAASGRLVLLRAHLLKVGVAVGALLLAMRLDAGRLRRWAGPCWVLAVGALVVVLVVGVDAGGARRWVRLGGVSLQPSEFARVAVVLAIAAWIQRRAGRMASPLSGLVVPFLLAAVPAALVLLEPDFGSAVCLLFMGVVAMWVGGARPLHLMGVFLAALALASLYGWERLAHVSRRLSGFLDPEVGSQVWQSLTALGAGGLAGRGLGRGLTGWGYVPEAENDFILAVVGENLGLLGTLSVVLLYGVVLAHGTRLVLALRSPFAVVAGAGLLFQILVQALLNIAVVTAMAPPKGLPLPFVSAGGSSLVVLAGSVGLLLGLARHPEHHSETIGATATSPHLAVPER